MLVPRTAWTTVRSLIPARPDRVIAVTYPPPLLSTISMRSASVSWRVPIALLIISETWLACVRACAGGSASVTHPVTAATVAAASPAHPVTRGTSPVMLPVSTAYPNMRAYNAQLRRAPVADGHRALCGVMRYPDGGGLT